jgi:ketosteroid isomerase-like protein
MSQENVELVKQAWEAWNRDDLDANLKLLHPEVELHTAIERNFEGTESVSRGHDGFRGLWASYRSEAFQRLEVRWHEFRDLGDSVLALGELRIIGQSSQVELTTEFTLHLTFRDGKIASSRDFLSHAEGLKAAGVSE